MTAAKGDNHSSIAGKGRRKSKISIPSHLGAIPIKYESLALAS